MSDQRPLRLVQGNPWDSNGELQDARDVEIVRLRATIEILEENLANANDDLASKRRQIKRLLSDKERDRQEHAKRTVIEDLHAHWQQATNHQRSPLTGDRFDEYERALRHYELEQIKLAFEGAGAFPYYDQKRIGHRSREGSGTKYTSVKHIFADADRFETLANLGHQERKRTA
jgi:hypothetical protein